MDNKFQIAVNSEVGSLEGVILHTPGPETENMTPQNAERALYSDILNLAVGSKEYSQLNEVLDKVTTTFQVKDLLTEILKNDKVKEHMIHKICKSEGVKDIIDDLMEFNPEQLATGFLEGVVQKNTTLTNYLSKERYSLRPLHNFFFTRDAAITIGEKVLIGSMANKVRARETMIMEAIFDYHPEFTVKTVNPANLAGDFENIRIEGGDVLIFRDDILLIGIGTRTSTQGVDFIAKKFRSKAEKRHIIIQELPEKPESFIHLDMVFTCLDRDKCMIYEPVILQPNKYRTVHIEMDNGKTNITREENLLHCLDKLGAPMETVICGGTKDQWIQEREQWHSGANFFALGPGKVIGYGRNVHTVEEMSRNGFEIIPAKDVMKGKVDLSTVDKYMVTIDGSELARGGGGCRCMTMPVRRAPLT